VLDAPFAPVYRTSSGLLAATRGLRDAAFGGYVGQAQPDELIVSFKRDLAQLVHHTAGNPLVACLRLKAVAEQVSPAILSEAQPKTNTSTSFSKTVRSGMRDR